MLKRNLTLLIVFLAALVIAFAPASVHAQPVERLIRVEASDYAFSPSVIHANPGDTVTIELVSKDVVHGLAIDGYPVNIQSDPGQPAQVTFVANKAGTFKLRCSVACGNLHPFMTGKISVGPNLLLYRAGGLALLAVVYSTWLAAARKEAA